MTSTTCFPVPEGGKAIACAADAGYVPHCATMLASLVSHPGPWDVHFLHDDSVSASDLEKLASVVPAERGTFTAHLIESSTLTGLPRLREVSVAMWLRVFLPDLLKQYRRVLYLDCDILVITDPSELWELDIGNAGLAAVNCLLPAAFRDWPARIGVDPNRYFNSGVLFMNLDIWRQESLGEKILAFGRDRASELRWPDQDALNVVFKDRWFTLHARYNAQNAFWFMPEAMRLFPSGQMREATAKPVIVHFEGPHLVKPWHRFSKNPYRIHYRKWRATTPWPLQALEGADHPLRMLHWLPARLLYGLLLAIHRLGRLFRR